MKETYLSHNEVKKLLGVSDDTLRRWRISGILPAAKIGRLLRYKESEISNCISSKKREVKDDK